MDGYYKIVSIIALVILVICLVLVGIALSKASSDSNFPPHVSDCPDFYVNDGTGVCTDSKGIASDASCKTFDPSTNTSYSNPGMGSTSGVCLKRRWAEGCGVNWDGITNNPDVCYKINS